MKQRTPSTKIILARWRAAKAEAEKINRYLEKGYLVLHRGTPNRIGKLTIERDGIVEYHDHVSFRWFELDTEYDHGIYNSIKETRRRFRNIEVFKPVGRRKNNDK